MKISIKTNQLELTPSLSEYIEEKIGPLEKFIERFEDEGEALAQVEIGMTSKHHKHGDVFSVEINLNVKGEILRVEEFNNDMHIAIDNAKDTLKKEIIKFKEIKTDKRVFNEEESE